MSRFDKRSDEAQEWRRWYSWAAWRKRREALFRDEPLCRFCTAQGRVTAATVADHIIPHRGDYDLFWSGALQPLCKSCHDAAKARIESFGWDSAADLDGYPLDPNHPSNVDARKRA